MFYNFNFCIYGSPHRYSIKAGVMDNITNVVFVIFDRDVTMLFNRTCADVLQSLGGAREGAIHPEISVLVNHTYLFKV